MLHIILFFFLSILFTLANIPYPKRIQLKYTCIIASSKSLIRKSTKKEEENEAKKRGDLYNLRKTFKDLFVHKPIIDKIL